MKLQLAAETVMDGMAASQDPGQAEQVVSTNLACMAGAELRLVRKDSESHILSRSDLGGPRLVPVGASTTEAPSPHRYQAVRADCCSEAIETGKKSGHE